MARGMPDPWTLAQGFIDNLNDMAAKNRYYSSTGENNMYRAMIDRQDAETLARQKMATDETNFNQQLLRDEAQREFYHNENWLRSQYGGGGAGSKSRFAPKTTQAPSTTMPPYQSPLSTTSSVTQAPQQPQQPQQPVPDTGQDAEISQRGAYTHFINRGVPPIVAAGLVANIEAESSFDPAVFSGQRRGDAGTAGYAGQWRGSRQQNLLNFAASRGHQQPTVADQYDFYLHEATSGSDEGATKAIALAGQAQTPEEAAKIIMQYYERPSSDPRENQQGHRERVARQVFESGGGAGGGTSLPTTTTQRRHPGPMVQPDNGTVQPESPYPVETSGPVPAQENTDIQDPEHVWTDEELNQYLAPDEVAAIKRRGRHVVGAPRIYTETQLELLPEMIRSDLTPVYKTEQYAPSEWLYTPETFTETTEDGTQTAQPSPQITTAPPVTIANPNDPKSTESTRVVNGQWEVLVDGKWTKMSNE